MNKYSVNLKWSEEDDGFVAIVPELKGLSAFGKTPREALAELEVASEAYIESWQASGRPLPPPEEVLAFSGQLRLRMPKGLHARMAQSARDQGVSLNTYLVFLLSERQAENTAIALLREGLKSIRTWSLGLLAGTSGSLSWRSHPERKSETSDTFAKATEVN